MIGFPGLILPGDGAAGHAGHQANTTGKEQRRKWPEKEDMRIFCPTAL
jgi:hypothetical protein